MSNKMFLQYTNWTTKEAHYFHKWLGPAVRDYKPNKDRYYNTFILRIFY